MSVPSEADLITRLIGGDEAAFRSVFRQHGRIMYGVALRLLSHNAADADDVVQEAWLRAVRVLPTFRRDSTLRTWLVGITVRCALEHGRRIRHGMPLASDTCFAPEPLSAERIDLERTIATLADGYRHVLVLHDMYGYTHAEIGELLGIDEGTSKSQLSRARQIVRRALDARIQQESRR